MSFATWFFDYDNDGALDLFVAELRPVGHRGGGRVPGSPAQAETTRLVPEHRQGIRRRERPAGVARVTQAMGANYGDIDNDGFLDVYLGTGAPSYASIVPNILWRNDAGRRFLDVTTASGTGHLQKGHGVGIGDLDGDGAAEIVVNVGGFVPGDAYWKSVFKNPGTPNHWLDVQLVGTKSNRAAVGATVDAWVRDASGALARRHRVVSSGGSFGSSSFTQHIGLGPSRVVERLEIAWPTSGIRQALTNVQGDRRIVVREGE